jgi:hypothetical protein
MAKVYEVKNAIQGIFDVVPGTVFNTDDGFYVLIALYNVVLRWCCVTTTSYKSTAGNYCINSFFKKSFFFGFIVTSPTTLSFGKLGNGTFSYWILVDFRDRH